MNSMYLPVPIATQFIGSSAIIVDIDVLIPWGSASTQVVSEVLIADTVVVGQVPGTYLDMNGNG